MKKEMVLERFVTGMPRRFEAATSDARLQGALVEIDPESGHASSIMRVNECLP
jgi:calcineurin-like phosphoesterase